MSNEGSGEQPTSVEAFKTKLEQALFIDPRRPETGAIWPLYPESFDDTESDTPKPTPYDQLLALVAEERRQAKIAEYERLYLDAHCDCAEMENQVCDKCQIIRPFLRGENK